MTTNTQHGGDVHDNSDGRVNHAAFLEMAQAMVTLLTTLEAKYQEGDELDPILVHNIIESMAAVLSDYAVARFCPADAEVRGIELNQRIVNCVTDVVGLTPVAPEVVTGTYPTGWSDPA